MKMQTAVIQFSVIPGDIDGNLTKATGYIKKAAAAGCTLAVLPEMWSSGFYYQDLLKVALASEYVLKTISDIAAKHRIAVSGSVPEADPGGVYNTMVTIDASGACCGAYRKIHLFTPTGENEHFQAGSTWEVMPIGGMDAGAMICYDLRFPELARTLVLAGAEILLVAAQWPAVRTGHWDTLLQARAIENQVYVLASNRTGADDGLGFAGHSAIIAPDGEVLARADREEGILMAEIDRDRVTQIRQAIPCLQERKTDSYEC